MDLTKFPLDICDYIFDFIFVKCRLCNKYIHYNNIIRNCRIFTYRNIYINEIPTEEEKIKFFNYICKPCLKSYYYNSIINFNKNTYFWIKDI